MSRPKTQPPDPCLSREQALALDTFLRHPALHAEELSFVGFVAVSEYALTGRFVRRLAAGLPLRVEPIAEIDELSRVCREGKSDSVYVILCNAFRPSELEQTVYPALSLYRDFIFERRLKHIYVGDAGFLAAAHQRLPDLFLIHQAVLQLDNLQATVRRDLAQAHLFALPSEPHDAWPERWSVAACLSPPPFDRSEGERQARQLLSLLPGASPYTDALRSLNLSALYLIMRDYGKAAAALEEAERLAAATGSREFAEAAALHRAFLLRGQGRWTQAAEAFRHFLREQLPAVRPILRITACAGLGDCLRLLNRPDQALRCFREALGLCPEAGAPLLQALTWVKIGEIHARRAAFPAARHYYRQALAVYTSRRCRISFAYTLLSLGYTYSLTDDRRFAAAYYREALSLFRAAGLAGGKVAALVCLARTFLEKAEAGEKEADNRISAYLAEAVRWAGRENEPAWLAEIETCAGRLAGLKGETGYAETAFRRAIALWQSLAPFDEREKEVVYALLGSSQARSALTAPEALAYLTHVKLYFDRTADMPSRIYTYRSLGDMYKEQGMPGQAEAYYKQAAALARRCGSLSMQASAQETLGKLYRETGKKEEAGKQLAEAMRIRRLIE